MTKLSHLLLSGLCVSMTLAGCGLVGNKNVDVRGLEAASRSTMGPEARAVEASRSQVTLRFNSRNQLEALAKAGVDLFENVDLEHGTVGASLTSKTLPVLKQLGVSYTLAQGATTLGFPSGYQTVEQITADVKALAAAHPEFMQVVEIGKSLEGRPLLALRVTSKRDANLPSIRLASGIHARELPPVEVMSRFAHLLADGYGKDAKVTKLVDTKDIWIVLLQNPDGRVRVEKGDSMWRKNTRKNGRWGSEGVDCNRNADDHFDGGDDNAWADDYRGSAPFSEPESQALRDLSAKHHFDISMDMHCYAGMILWPPGYDTSTTADEAAFARIGGTLGKNLGYKYGTIAKTIYKTYGDIATWEYNAHKTLAFAAELDCGGFNPSYSEVDRQWAKWKDNLLFLVGETGSNRGSFAGAPGFAVR